jgi:hypothetical protein
MVGTVAAHPFISLEPATLTVSRDLRLVASEG